MKRIARAGAAAPLDFPPTLSSLPSRALWRSVRSRQSHVWVQHMPENSERPIAAGIEFYN